MTNYIKTNYINYVSLVSHRTCEWRYGPTLDFVAPLSRAIRAQLTIGPLEVALKAPLGGSHACTHKNHRCTFQSTVGKYW